MADLVRTYGLTKAYKDKTVVSGIDMRVRQGEIYGFLGPNGAGKTTVMRMMLNLARPTGGRIELFGEELTTASSREALKKIGSMIEYPKFYEHLSGRENLKLHCEYMGFYDPKAADEALELCGLAGHAGPGDKPVKHYSLGMKQRLGIARAVAARPRMLLLDEPVNGLDPLGIHDIRELFRRLNREYGMTLLISSHILQEIELLADTIGVIDRGRLVKEVAMETVRAELSHYTEVVTTNGKQAAYVLEDKLKLTNYKLVDDHTVRIYEPDLSGPELSKTLVLSGVGIESLTRANSTLESYFLKLIQGGDPDA